MSVSRSVKTRMIEGLIRDFKADTDANTYFAGRFFSGPLLDDVIVKVPQVNLSILPSDTFEPGVANVSNDLIPVFVKCYFPPDLLEYKTGSSHLTPHDYAEHLEKIIMTGSVDPVSGVVNANDPGLILDPDWTNGVDPVNGLRWLNVSMATFSYTPAVLLKGNVGILLAFSATFETRLKNVTRARA